MPTSTTNTTNTTNTTEERSPALSVNSNSLKALFVVCDQETNSQLDYLAEENKRLKSKNDYLESQLSYLARQMRYMKRGAFVRCSECFIYKTEADTCYATRDGHTCCLDCAYLVPPPAEVSVQHKDFINMNMTTVEQYYALTPMDILEGGDHP